MEIIPTWVIRWRHPGTDTQIDQRVPDSDLIAFIRTLLFNQVAEFTLKLEER